MNYAGGDVRGDSAICYSTDWDRLYHDSRRQTNFTLLGEPLQSWHHNVSCLCQRKERDKWLCGAALLLDASNIWCDTCFIQGCSRCGFASFITWSDRHAIMLRKTDRPRSDGESNMPVSQLIKTKHAVNTCYLQSAGVCGDQWGGTGKGFF